MSAPLERVVLIGRDIELRIVSLIVRCREVANEVLLFDTGSNDETVELANEVNCEVVHHDGEITPQLLAKALMSLEAFDGLTLFLPISSQWKLSDLPLSVNRAREGWDIHHLYRSAPMDEEVQGVRLSLTDLGHLVLSPRGAEHLSSLAEDATTEDISEDIRARFVKSDVPIHYLSGNRWPPHHASLNFFIGCWNQNTRSCCSAFLAWCSLSWVIDCLATLRACLRNSIQRPLG